MIQIDMTVNSAKRIIPRLLQRTTHKWRLNCAPNLPSRFNAIQELVSSQKPQYPQQGALRGATFGSYHTSYRGQPINSDHPEFRICHLDLMQSKHLYLPRNLNTLNKELQEELHCEADLPPCRSPHYPKGNRRRPFA
ncbi:hypothetical protein CDAR_286801 [Caerostris darwini]|uniref:Uncharacterized protein n=1 Tax=Caerostris darwini TaxID=1538125 RepID=A0AAV4RD91_9ARAC|nr:hypothetical protein CDAR_286801 [Caerostris darwini]